MEQINYENLIPTQPEQDVVGYAYQTGAFKRGYLIYKADRAYVALEDRWEQVVHVVCSECEREFHAMKINAGGCGHALRYGFAAPFGWWNEATGESVISGSETTCPYCGQNAETIHVGSIGRHYGEIIDDVWVSTLSRLPVAGQQDRLVLTDWCIRRCINKQGYTRHEIWPYTAWVVEEKKIVRLMGYTKCMMTISLSGRWAQRKTFADGYGEIHRLMPWDKKLLEGTTAENSKLNLYLEAGGRRPVSYLALWRRRPAVENLLMQGCGHLVAEWIKTEASAYLYHAGIPKLNAVNWKEKRPAQMLGLDKAELRRLRQESWDADRLERYKLARDNGIMAQSTEDEKLLLQTKSLSLGSLREISKTMHGPEFWRTLRYLKKRCWAWYTLRDYWDMAGQLDWDLTDSLVRWPRDLNAAHDRAMRERKHRRNELLTAGFRKRAAELARLSFELDGLLIRPCRDQAELNAEGKTLHHCVGIYGERHANGQTAIFFIRRKSCPGKPYFTLELDEKKLTVRQNRGLRNCDPPEEVKEFVAGWLKWARSGAPKARKTKQKAEAA